MTRKIRIWLAPILMIVLLVAHETAQGQIDDTAANRMLHAQPDRGASQPHLPLLTILEAKDLPGYTVTVKGKVVSVPNPQSDDRCIFVLEDETGSLLLSAKAELHVGDIIQVTGKLGNMQEAAILKADAAEIYLIR